METEASVERRRRCLAYADLGENAGDRADVFFVRSTDGGVTWTTPVRVNSVWNNDQWMPVMCVRPDGAKLFIGWYDRRNDPNNGLIDFYGRWGTINADGSVAFSDDFRISTQSFPPVFVGTLPDRAIIGHYDPCYPPGDSNLNWWYSDWPLDDPPLNEYHTSYAYIAHVGEYNGACADPAYVYAAWADARLTSVGTRYPRNQMDIRLLKLAWPQ